MPYPSRWILRMGKVRESKTTSLLPDEGRRAVFLRRNLDEWRSDRTSIKTCAIVTTAPNKLLASIHDRMPVILPNEVLDSWIRSNTKLSELRELLIPFTDSEMEGFPVSQDVNGSEADHPGLVEPLPAGELVRNRMLF